MVTLMGLAVLLTGCGGLDRSIKDRFKNAAASFDTATTDIAKQKKTYESLLSNEGAWAKPYAEREKLATKFTEASGEVKRLQGIYDGEIQKLIDANKGETATTISTKLDQVRTGLMSARDVAAYPAKRIQTLISVRKTADKVHETAQSQIVKVTPLHEALTPVIAESKESHPGRADDISSRTATVPKLYKSATEAFETLTTQYKLHQAESTETDYAAFADASSTLAKALETLTSEDRRIRGELAELDVTRTRTLVDMKTQCFITVKQSTWDEYSDYGGEHEKIVGTYELTNEAFEAATQLNDGALCAYGSGWGSSFTAKAPASILSSAQLSESRCRSLLARGDTHGEWWVEDWNVKCFHKYLEEANGVTKETDWVEVDEEDFAYYAESLGMTIEAKPYGVFADEVDDVPAPAGMAYVGNDKYGEWKQDSNNGTSFWVFYGQYRFFSDLMGPSPYYYRSDYDGYRTSRASGTPYYGGSSTSPKYGSRGSTTKANSRFARSTFTKTGGFSRTSATIRSAGVSARSGGPGGGGK